MGEGALTFGSSMENELLLSNRKKIEVVDSKNTICVRTKSFGSRHRRIGYNWCKFLSFKDHVARKKRSRKTLSSKVKKVDSSMKDNYSLIGHNFDVPKEGFVVGCQRMFMEINEISIENERYLKNRLNFSIPKDGFAIDCRRLLKEIKALQGCDTVKNNIAKVVLRKDDSSCFARNIEGRRKRNKWSAFKNV